MQWASRHVLTFCVQVLSELRRLDVTVLTLVVGHRLLVQVNEQHVFHKFILPRLVDCEAAKSSSGRQIFYDLRSTMISPANSAVEAAYRSDWGRIVATLIRSFGDFDVAEEAAQEAFAAAVRQWRVEGIPDSPAAWI